MPISRAIHTEETEGHAQPSQHVLTHCGLSAIYPLIGRLAEEGNKAYRLAWTLRQLSRRLVALATQLTLTLYAIFARDARRMTQKPKKKKKKTIVTALCQVDRFIYPLRVRLLHPLYRLGRLSWVTR